MATLADLEAIIRPAAAEPPAIDWLELERVSGLVFPSDYKAFASRYGMLEIEAFMDVDHLGLYEDAATVIKLSEDALRPLRELVEDEGSIWLIDDSGSDKEARPYPFYPAIPGLFPWGATQNGDTLLWLTGPDPEQWTTVVTDGGLWWHFDGGMIDFLVGMLSRTVRCPILPKNFPSDLHVSQYVSLDELP